LSSLEENDDEHESDVESDEDEFILSISRPGFMKTEDFNVPELFCGANHDIREQNYPFFNKNFTCVEDKGSSLKYLR
jgi:hypothetical protein